MMELKIAYEQAAQLNRYFLNWRQAMLAGYIAVLYGTGSLAIQACEKAPALVWPILLAAGSIGITFFLAELRNRECYHRAAQVAKAIELGDKPHHDARDLFAAMENPPNNWPRNWVGPHSLATMAVYLGFTACLTASALHFYFAPVCR